MNAFHATTSQSGLALFSNAFHRAVQQGHAAALWALPGSENIRLLIDRSPVLHKQPTSWVSDRGFVLHAFTDKAGEQSLLLKPDLLFQLHAPETLADPELLRYAGKELLPFPFDLLPAIDFSEQESAQSAYTCKVEHLLEELKHSPLKKIVLARNRKAPYPAERTPVEAVVELRKAYPNAFVAIAYHPAAGCWAGASPELLVSSDAKGIFKTVALAGTQIYNPDKSLKEHAWSNKEIEEQALVSRYIVNCFKAIQLREYEEEGPKNYLSGNLVHLCTNYRIDAHALGIPNLPDLLLPLLHPTSATCGSPKEKAMELILQYENVHRHFYSGFWGPVNMDGHSAVYVNLRSAQWMANGYSAYAGAGITEDSVPSNEWTETEHKLEAIQKIWSSNS